MAHTEHDEAAVRASWHGESWLGEESVFAPVHGAPREILGDLAEALSELGLKLER